jgi:hypothetical protein
VPVFLKQYGARRTGTNHLRSLIRANYDDVIPLMHVLGDKHSPPPPFDTLWHESPTPLAFAMTTTAFAPAASTHLEREEQRREVERVAAPLAEAYANGTLGFVISIKDPYAWIPSLARYHSWIPWNRTSVVGPELAPKVVEACRELNTVYAAWLALERRHIVRHEDLVADPEETLRGLDAAFGLARTKPLVSIATEAYALDWDHVGEKRSGSVFDREYYVEKKYLARLSPEVRDAVTQTVDWELFAKFGYVA